MLAKLATPKALDAAIEKKPNTLEMIDMENIKRGMEVFREIVAPYSLNLAKAASKKEREEKKMSKDPNFVYSEVVYETLGIALEKIKSVYGKPGTGSSGPEGVLQTRGGVFYDLGSGIMKHSYSK